MSGIDLDAPSITQRWQWRPKAGEQVLYRNDGSGERAFTVTLTPQGAFAMGDGDWLLLDSDGNYRVVSDAAHDLLRQEGIAA